MKSNCVRLLGIAFVALVCHAQSWAQAQYNIAAGATTSLPANGSLNIGCLPMNVQGTLNVNSGQVNGSGTVSIQGGVVNGGTGTINVGGSWSNNGTFNAGSGTVVFDAGCTAGQVQITGNTVFNNLTLSSSTGTTFVIPAGSNITVNGILTLQGANGTPIQLVSSNGQPAIITMGPGAQLVSSNATVPCSVQIGSVAPQCQSAVPTLSSLGRLLLSVMVLLVAAWFGKPYLLKPQR